MITNNPLDKLFYVIYNAYYKHGRYKNDIPTLTVGGIFCMFFTCTILSIYCLIGWAYPEYKQIPEGVKSVRIFVMLGLVALTYLIFYHNKRYRRIYEKYKDNSFLNQPSANILAFAIVVIVLLSPFIFALLRNKFTSGRWF